jgi:hypothetical protein
VASSQRRSFELVESSTRDLAPDVIEPLYKAIGTLVVNWAYVDRSLDFWIAVIYHDVGGKNLENKLPQASNVKRNFCGGASSKSDPYRISLKMRFHT